jgi:hypothetical protein
MDKELQIVLQDLDFFHSEWDQDVSDESLRRSSPVLRRFLVEEQLLRAWRSTGLSGQPEVLAPTLSKRLTVASLNAVRFATAERADYKGMTVALFFQSDEALTPAQIKKISELGPPEAKQTLTEFTNSTCMIVEGTPITRIELIKYVANKLGGAHYDSKRDKDYQRRGKERSLLRTTINRSEPSQIPRHHESARQAPSAINLMMRVVLFLSACILNQSQPLILTLDLTHFRVSSCVPPLDTHSDGTLCSALLTDPIIRKSVKSTNSHSTQTDRHEQNN